MHLVKWNKQDIREQQKVIQGKKSPTIVLTNCTYLNHALKAWVEANIWIYKDRIIYVGSELPEENSNTQYYDCAGRVVVPGYIEPHAHPFQLYNPQSLADYASQGGTTTFVCDNLMNLLLLSNKKALSLMERLNDLPYSFYWWCRYDGQTELQNEDTVFSGFTYRSYLNSPYVIQGGELTSWPKVLEDDDNILHWMLETKKAGKKIEGHLPGASQKTLTQMALFGVDCDHEALNGTEVLRRLELGYTVSLRHSSIRPDLPTILSDLNELGITHYERMFFTTDGSTPCFYKEGVIDTLIKIAIEHGVPPLDAYSMGSYNVARHYGFDHTHGMIAPGRMANLNILIDEVSPTPESVLAKGKWVKLDGKRVQEESVVEWDKFGMTSLELNWDLSLDDMNFTMPVGIEMVNAVITKPYNIQSETATDSLEHFQDECFFMMLDRHGKWHINTVLKGFANVSGLASSYSSTGDIILIGKNKTDMLLAFNKMKEIGGGIVLTEHGAVIAEIPLDLEGVYSSRRMEEVIENEHELVLALQDRGYHFIDPIYSLLFFSSTHLPYVRITQKGIYDVKKKTVLFPSIMR